ncbi:AraC family transcriptional regulator [Paenibacillus sp. URB8-2]|uniref:AraC family transcriptional regulator n=1 Tax=Paenibacillus sp. URB8-2 TaxID=2741301 RepID=UPI0015BB888D|nr:AraC family transcriptional regulator [Paenibacillus sp. URB8-2]BCG58283.1 AraC family transcriptional regulator [Paenibacillus sp. URB8-2]
MATEPTEHMLLTFSEEDGEFLFEHINRPQPFGMNDHYHDTYEIYYLVAGERNYFIRDRTYDVDAGDLVFINKNEVHKTSDLGMPGHERILINFSEAFLTGGGGQLVVGPEVLGIFHQDTHLLRLKPPEQAFIQSLFGKLAHELARKQSGWECYIRLLVIELLLFAARHTHRNAAASTESNHPLHKKISEIVHFINQNYREPLRLAELSERFYISPYYLSRKFRKVTGFSLIEYVNLKRITEAQRLLRETDGKIIEISSSVGFDNPAHFNRIFKQIAGTTPMNYRKMHRI